MKIPTITLHAFLLFILAPHDGKPQELPAVAPELVGMSSEKLALVDSAMQESVTEKKIPGGVVIIARHGKIVHFKAYGKMDLEANKPMQTDSILRIYSMTKAITTTAAMMLIDAGKLAVEDPVGKYLPEVALVTVADGDQSRPAKRTMTIADLMLHTAGYSYGGSGVPVHDEAYAQLNILDTAATLEAMQAKLTKLPLAFEPGTDWHYGISIDILGRVVEVASGQTLEAFFNQRIFHPLDMPDTGFYVPAEKADRFAANYRSDGQGNLTVIDRPSESRYLIQPALFGGGGGLVSTARDYMRFLVMIANGGELNGKRLLKSETVKLMITNHLSPRVGWVKFGDEIREGVGFGYGFNVRDKMSDWDPQGRIGEYGWGGAASTHYWVSPKDDLAVITLEQIMPYSFMTEFKLKGLIYDAIVE